MPGTQGIVRLDGAGGAADVAPPATAGDAPLPAVPVVAAEGSSVDGGRSAPRHGTLDPWIVWLGEARCKETRLARRQT